ncbi:MAG TPA: MarR family winged helix-turn-helix transcriptional regulator [Solirubrobacterales bacterium]|jgi:DNA-binding MarR family transcriptional regulator|nr:MarR family winged helix-turn-helix transcriptional regulator [Solirubrobacterales bacterium]
MSDGPHTPHPPETLLSLLDAATESVLAEFRRDLEEAGYADIRPTHGCVFRFVRDDGMRLTELAGLAGMTKQSVGELVDDLVDLGYVERIPDPEDRRAKLICLTDRGIEAQRVAFGLLADVEDRWAERFGATRMKQLRKLLEAAVSEDAPGAAPELRERRLASVS